MPPKKKKEPSKKSKDAKKEEPEEVISEEFVDLNIAQLKERSDAASYQYTKSAKERNFMQVEVDLVQRLYDITKDEVPFLFHFFFNF